ncbi:MAG TPA: DUF3540 domain-containing protein [Dyella sp.]|uniref:DUF3540 domain-containing protein n=1 Tax=Dyella sp. TaxID=1869338 RepID=UPI002F932AF5
MTSLAIDAAGVARAIDRPTDTVKKAASCLLALHDGDLVRVIHHDGVDYVTDILVRRGEDEQVIDMGPQPLRIQAGSLELTAARAMTLRASRLTLIGALSSWVSRQLALRTGRLSVKAGDVRRQIRGVDATHAHHLHQRADEAVVVRGRVGSVRMDGVLRMDGGQVHVG